MYRLADPQTAAATDWNYKVGGNIVIPYTGARAKIFSVSSLEGATGTFVAPISVPISKKNFSIPPSLVMTIITASSFPVFAKRFGTFFAS
jgi:hypothetical protein